MPHEQPLENHPHTSRSVPPQAPRRGWLIAAIALASAALGVLAAGPIRIAVLPLFHALKPVTTEDGSAETHGEGVTLYQSGMHPWIITTEPGNCPICGMKMEPIDPAKLAGEITIDPVVVQNLGIRTTPVVTGPLTQTIRTVGSIDYAEPLIRDVNLRVSGWIETLHVDFVGAEVEKGDVLFEIYSPQLYAAQEEFLLTQRHGQGGDTDNELLRSARDRLRNFGLTKKQIDHLADTGQAQPTIPILSPHAGVVIDKHANEGMDINPGMRVFRIADLSRLWVRAAIYEHQLPFVQAGQPATMTLSHLPSQAHQGRVAFVYPSVDPKTRQAQAILAFDNPQGQLKPGMFADVQLQHTRAADAVLVPRDAVIDTGQRKIAFVSLGQGRFEPRHVRAGAPAQGHMLQILDGLEPGERVVTSGQFLLDSEASVRESLARMMPSQPTPQTQPAGATTQPTPSNTPDLNPQAQEQIDALATAYFALTEALTRDSLDQADTHLKTIADAAEHLHHLSDPHTQPLAAAVKSSADIPTRDLAAFRAAFSDLSDAMIALLADFPPSEAVTLTTFIAHCPMVNHNWLQTGDQIRNPYATYMPTCGTIERAITSPPKTGGNHAH